MRPTISWSELRGASVGVWGLGVEGLANVRKLGTLGVTPVLVDDQPRPAAWRAARCWPPRTAAWPRWPAATWW